MAEIFFCEACGGKGKNFYNFNIHLSTKKHKMNVKENIDGIYNEYECKDCNKFFSSKKTYEHHITTDMHKRWVLNGIPKKKITGGKKGRKKGMKMDKVYQCERCNKKCATEYLLKRHMSVHGQKYNKV